MVAEKKRRGEDSVVVPAFDPKALQKPQGVEASELEVAIQQGLPRPADLGQVTIGLEQRAGMD